MRDRLRGGIAERAVRAMYYRARGLAPAADWYRESDERAKFVHILEAVNHIRVAGLPPVFFEFGCHSARTFSAAVLAARFFRMHLDAYAFDSFEGLPENDEDTTGLFAKGAFRTDVPSFKKRVRALSGLRVLDDHIVPGFFESSLTHDLSDRLPARVGFAHIDVDLYRSTVPVLDFLRDKLVDGAVLLFDDWYAFPQGESKGERRAMEEFRANSPSIAVEDWKNYSAFGKSMFVASKASQRARAASGGE